MAIDLGISDVDGAIEIGRGGFGVVYKAHQSRFDRTIAVKVLEQAVLDEAGRQRFERECKALGALSGHPNVVTIYDSGFTPAGWPYLVLEYLPDGSLGDRIDRDGPFEIDHATELTVRIAGALETAHRIGVLHRDMKPENILLGPYDEPKLGDFGIARVQGATVTATSTIWGSPAHAAPEIIEGKGATAQTDVYSLGSTLYVLLSGRLAFQRDTDESIIPVLARIATEPPPDLRSLGVPQAVWDVLERSMRKDPALRQATALEFGTELQGAREAIGLEHAEMRVKGEQRRSTTGGGRRSSASLGAPSAPGITQGPATGATNTPHPGTTSYTPQPVNSHTPPPGAYGGGTSSYTPGAQPSGQYAPGPPTVTPPPYATGPVAGGGGGGNTKVWIGAAAALVILLVLVGVVVAIATRSSSTADPPGTTLPAIPLGSSTTQTTAPQGNSVSEEELASSLLEPDGIEGTWKVSNDAESFGGFTFLEPCNESVETDQLKQQQSTLFEGSTSDDIEGRIFQAVGEFEDDDAARGFMNRLPTMIACGSWTDSGGEDHEISAQTISAPQGDQSFLFEDLVTEGSSVYDHDLVFYRIGRFVGFVTNLTVEPNNKDFTETLLADGVSKLEPIAT